MDNFSHVSIGLQEEKKIIFTAQSCKNFHQRMLISKFAFEQGAIPINPFNLFGYFLYELVDRDMVRNANNNILKRCDELWVFGEISDGVLAEILMCKELGKPVRYFDISELPEQIIEISAEQAAFEKDCLRHKELLF